MKQPNQKEAKVKEELVSLLQTHHKNVTTMTREVSKSIKRGEYHAARLLMNDVTKMQADFSLHLQTLMIKNKLIDTER